MESLEKLYTDSFFERRNRLAWRSPIVGEPIIEELRPSTLIDVGCASGDLVDFFIRAGVNAFGLEGSPVAFKYLICPKERVIQHDLRDPLLRLPMQFPQKFDVVLCLEVAEHIEQEFADMLMWNLQSLAREWIVMSAARPGQEGVHHFNCQDPDYWKDKIDEFRFKYDPEMKNKIKSYWVKWKDKKGIKAYYDNLLVFKKIDDEDA